MSPKPERAPRTFEAAFAELQSIVERLEDGALSLDDVLALYDRGLSMAATCEQLLADAELRVTRLTPESAIPEPPSPDAAP